MPKKSRCYPTFREFQKDRHNEYAGLVMQMATVRALRDEFAGPVIAHGVFGPDPLWDDIVEMLVNREPWAVTLSEGIQAFFDRARADGEIDDDILSPTTDDPKRTEHVDDALTSLLIAWKDAGFALGLAVGSALGPNALEGGVR